MMVEIEKIKITDITPADYNPRLISESETNKLKNSLSTFGLVDPIVINLKNNHIIGGHQRFDVLIDQHLEDNTIFEELNLIRLGDIGWVFTDTDLKIESEDHEKALNLALNKISGDWDYDKLTTLFSDLQMSDLDVELTGFDDTEIEVLLDDFEYNEEVLSIENGYYHYKLVCRTSDENKKKNVTKENATGHEVGVYDVDKNILYYYWESI